MECIRRTLTGITFCALKVGRAKAFWCGCWSSPPTISLFCTPNRLRKRLSVLSTAGIPPFSDPKLAPKDQWSAVASVAHSSLQFSRQTKDSTSHQFKERHPPSPHLISVLFRVRRRRARSTSFDPTVPTAVLLGLCLREFHSPLSRRSWPLPDRRLCDVHIPLRDLPSGVFRSTPAISPLAIGRCPYRCRLPVAGCGQPALCGSVTTVFFSRFPSLLLSATFLTIPTIRDCNSTHQTELVLLFSLLRRFARTRRLRRPRDFPEPRGTREAHA
jgi:hypothetical protein